MSLCKSLSQFEFIFMHGVRVCSSFTDLHAALQFSHHHLLKTLFPILYSCLLCRRLIDYRCLGLFLGSLFCSFGLYICFGTSTTLSLLMQLNLNYMYVDYIFLSHSAIYSSVSFPPSVSMLSFLYLCPNSAFIFHIPLGSLPY